MMSRRAYVTFSLLALSVHLSACAPGQTREAAAPPSTSGQHEHLLDLEFSYTDSASIAELQRIHAVTDHVHRETARLVLRLDNGDTVVFQDQAIEGDDYQRFSFGGTLEDLGYFLVEALYYESSGYVAINRRTGVRSYLDVLPVLSPDRQRLVTAHQDLYASYMPNRIQIFIVGPDSLSLEWEHEQDDQTWGPSDPEWIDPHTIRFLRHVPDYISPNTPVEPMLLYRDGGQWRMKEERSRATR